MARQYYYSDGSVLVHHDGSKMLHREDGPAVELPARYKLWYIYGKKHRVDGPAFQPLGMGLPRWYIDGERLTEEQFEAHPKRQRYLFEQELEKVLNG